MSTAGELLSRASRRLAHRDLTASERRVVARLVDEGKLVVSQPARFIYYVLPKAVPAGGPLPAPVTENFGECRKPGKKAG